MNLKSFILKIYIPNYENILEYSFSNGQLCIENKDSFTPNANVKIILETNCRKFFSEMYSYPNCKKKNTLIVNFRHNKHSRIEK